MALSSVLDFIGKDLKEVASIMRRALSSDIALLDSTNESILSNDGKMMRPMITILSALACSGERNPDTLAYAGAVEILHNATLLHDDVVDCSSTRRGKPTVVSLMGAGPSVLIGDYWLVKAVDLVLSSKQPLRVARLFSKTLSDLASGEMLQLQCTTSCSTTLEEYYRIIYSKTATLFETSGLVGAISVDADPSKEEAVKEFTYNLGMAFQIKDDILDYEGSEKMGKPAGQDLKEQKITLPLFGAFASAGPQKEKQIRSLLCSVTETPSVIDTIISFVKEYDGVAWAEKVLGEWVDKALSSLRTFTEGRARMLLEELTVFVSQRNR
jgi:octaprenyl-diphosphate synthase